MRCSDLGPTVALVLCLFTVAAAPSRAEDKPPSPAKPGSEPKAEVGLLAGGSGYLQLAFRFHPLHPLVIEMGALGIGLNGAAGNASVGLGLELSRRTDLIPFLSVGAAAAAGCGEGVKDGSKPGHEQIGLLCTGRAFGYGRFGITYQLTADGHRFMLDGGAWYGVVGSEGHRNRTFLAPMIGVGFYMPI